MWNVRRGIVWGALTLAVSPQVGAGQLARQPASPFRPPNAAPRELPLAADGYCVVTLRDQQRWQAGDRRIAAQFDGRQYLFAGERELAIFAAAPTTYAPVLSGDCVVTFAESGKRVPGRVQFGLMYAGRLYFFGSEEARAKFAAEPARYENADIADGGRCLVSRVEFHRDVAGLPETYVLTNGMRRLFAGAYEQSLYLQRPDYFNQQSAAPGEAPPGTVSVPLAGSEWRPRLAAGAAVGIDALGGDRTGQAAGSDATVGREAGAKGGDARQIAGSSIDNDLKAEPVMGGYCPVTIRDKGVWVRGRYDDFVEVENLIFYTAGAAEREAFLADRAQYIPALGGNCVVSFVDRSAKVRGSVFHATKYQGRLYLFADAECKAVFDAEPARYMSVDIAAGGDCVVTLAEEGRSQPGFAEFAAWHDGKLYRFAGEEQKMKFLAAPDKYGAAANSTANSAIAPPVPLQSPPASGGR